MEAAREGIFVHLGLHLFKESTHRYLSIIFKNQQNPGCSLVSRPGKGAVCENGGA